MSEQRKAEKYIWKANRGGGKEEWVWEVFDSKTLNQILCGTGIDEDDCNKQADAIIERYIFDEEFANATLYERTVK